MSEKNILMKMSIEKNRLINEVIMNFLGHIPGKEERKKFNIMHSLGESKIYYKGKLLRTVRYETHDETAVI